MHVVLNIDADQIIEAAAKMSTDDKLRLYDKIKDEILQVRLEMLREEFKDSVTLSDEEILQENGQKE
jgi:hypothetical protein